MLQTHQGKINNIINQRPLLFVVIFCGLAGLCLGFSNATWQVAVETAQVISHIVKYPTDNPFYIYHRKAFTIINYITALLLKLIGSERIVTILISGFLGMVSFQAIGLLIFSINKNAWLAILGTILIYFANYVGKGVVYPVWMLGIQHTYGILGLSFIVLTIALISNTCYRIGLFFLGIAPCIHLSWGAWLILVFAISAIWSRNFFAQVIKRKYWFFLAGLFITVSLFTYHLYSIRMLPKVEAGIEKQYLISYINYWDAHRAKLYWDSLDDSFLYHRWGLVLCAFSIIAGFIGLRYFKEKESTSFLFKIIIVSGISSLLAGIITQIPPEKVPVAFLILMPGRYINLNNFMLAAVLVGLLTIERNKKYIVNYNLFAFFLICSFFTRHAEVQLICFGLAMIWLAYVLINKFSCNNKKLLLQRSHKIGYEALMLIVLVAFLSVNILFSKKYVNHYIIRQDTLKDRTNDEFYAKISKREGLLLATIHNPMISIKTRRPVLVDMSSPNFFIYAPGSVLIYDNILKKVYGVDLMIPPPIKYQHLDIPFELYQAIWENRTLEQWQDIREEFGVSDILVTSDVVLSLPVIAENSKGILYGIPITNK
ncbi:MAG: hypothetical protein JXA96_16240 [Sedimentisphaerales bacterium]|nr:hypothetical protein [Sedimentisphaerales bacterium]